MSKFLVQVPWPNLDKWLCKRKHVIKFVQASCPSSCPSSSPLEAAGGWCWITGAFTTTRRGLKGGSDVFALTDLAVEQRRGDGHASAPGLVVDDDEHWCAPPSRSRNASSLSRRRRPRCVDTPPLVAMKVQSRLLQSSGPVEAR